MRFSRWLLTAAAAGLAAFAASAQDSAAPAEDPPAKAKAEAARLPDIEQTVEELLREESAPAGQPVPPAEPPPEEPQPQPREPQPQPQEPQPEEPPPAAAPTPPAPAAPASTASQPAPPLTREQIATLDRTVARGRLLIEIARAGIFATQDMLTRVSDPNGVGISGWIAEPAGNSMLVTFYANGEGETAAPKAVYRVTILGGRVTSREIFLGADRPALNPVQARMAAARTASDSDELRACNDQPFNVFVVPPAGAGAPVDVYRMTALAQRGRIPLGGHYRSTVASDGSVETHRFANACPNIDVPAAAEGAPPRPVGLTHLADPLPTEIHMLIAQSAGRPLLVVAGDPQRVWLVTGEGLAEIRDQARR